MSSLYDLLNIDALLVMMEKDLSTFSWTSTSGLPTGMATNGRVIWLFLVVVPPKWRKWRRWRGVTSFEPSRRRRVLGPARSVHGDFIKDTAKVSIKDQLSKGLEGLRERLRDQRRSKCRSRQWYAWKRHFSISST